MKLKAWLIGACALSASLMASDAKAAPQILAALPMESGIELACSYGICAAQLTTYCLQRERPAPTMGAAYVPATKEHFTLVLTSTDGQEVRLPASEHMRFVENRGFMSVAASIELGRMKALGAQSAKIVVWEGASLIPVPEENDPNPLTEDEIAFVTNSLRTIGQDYVDHQPKAGSAQLLAQLNAALPSDGIVAANTFNGMWQNSIGDEIPLPASGAILESAEQAFEECSGRASTYMVGGLRRCLEFQHDNMIRGLNVEYWQNQPGS